MEAPLGILFLKKAELYNLITRFNEQKDIITDDVNDKESSSGIPSSWPVEKKILKWSYAGHKLLAEPLVPGMLKKGNKKLIDWGLADKNGEIIKDYEEILKYPNHILQNIVIKGFADCYNKEKYSKEGIKAAIKDGILLNREGLLLGEVISNVEEKKPRVERIYRYYSWLMDYGGAWILLILFIIAIVSAFFTNLWNMFSQLITWLIDIW